ncbi:hypothetical protein FRB99_005563 [Tulasnella sp. 403]|nr:hypothetical protein FRB99_005563 [Tulasnella sp. 403]
MRAFLLILTLVTWAIAAPLLLHSPDNASRSSSLWKRILVLQEVERLGKLLFREGLPLLTSEARAPLRLLLDSSLIEQEAVAIATGHVDAWLREVDNLILHGDTLQRGQAKLAKEMYESLGQNEVIPLKYLLGMGGSGVVGGATGAYLVAGDKISLPSLFDTKPISPPKPEDPSPRYQSGNTPNEYSDRKSPITRYG